MDPDNIPPRSEPSPQRNPWSPNHYASSTTPTIVWPPNLRQQRYHSVSRKRDDRENSSSGAWSHKAEPPSAPSERVSLDDDGQARREKVDDDALTYTQRLYDHIAGKRFTASRMGHHRHQRTPRPPTAAGHGAEEQQRHYQEDGFENIELGGGDGFMMVESNSPGGDGYAGGKRRRGRNYYRPFSWWHDEYVYVVLSIVAIIGLAVFLRTYDGQVLPQEFGWVGLSFETGVVALVTAMRLCMDAYVGSAISQGVGCGHLGCVEAAIAILSIGFETFSQEMSGARAGKIGGVGYLSSSGVLGDLLPSLSTKAAVYAGIISTEVPMLPVSCETANCSWPIIPTLASCGDCVDAEIFTRCNRTANTCTYKTASGTFIVNSMDPGERSIFRVAPTNGTVHQISSTSRAYFSVFDLLSVMQTEETGLLLTASECALWFCLEGLKVSVEDGRQNQTRVANHSLTSLAMTNVAHRAEHVFIHIPSSLNTVNTTKYAVTHEAMLALRNFMASITMGTVTTTLNTLESSSDWVEAMWNANTGDLNQWISTFAASLTNEFRLHGTITGTSTKQYDGAATQMTPVVKVKWYWLLYPAFMILLSIYFLFHTIVACSMDGVRAWKGEVLPLLFCRVDEGLYERGRDGLEVPGGLDKRVAGENVAMYRSVEDGGWMFRGVEDGERDEETEEDGVVDEKN